VLFSPRVKGPFTDLFKQFASENSFAYNLAIFGPFDVISCVLPFSLSVTSVMTSAGYAHSYVTHCEKI